MWVDAANEDLADRGNHAISRHAGTRRSGAQQPLTRWCRVSGGDIRHTQGSGHDTRENAEYTLDPCRKVPGVPSGEGRLQSVEFGFSMSSTDAPSAACRLSIAAFTAPLSTIPSPSLLIYEKQEADDVPHIDSRGTDDPPTVDQDRYEDRQQDSVQHKRPESSQRSPENKLQPRSHAAVSHPDPAGLGAVAYCMGGEHASDGGLRSGRAELLHKLSPGPDPSPANDHPTSLRRTSESFADSRCPRLRRRATSMPRS